MKRSIAAVAIFGSYDSKYSVTSRVTSFLLDSIHLSSKLWDNFTSSLGTHPSMSAYVTRKE